MKHSISLLITLYMLCAHFAQAQLAGLQNYAPQTPAVAAMNRYGDIPVSEATGVPSISVPLYTLEEGALSVPLQASYHAGGVKAQDQATWVGLGWTLAPAGTISRSINSLPDENPGTNIPQTSGWWAQKGNQIALIPARAGYCLPEQSGTAVDMEPDLFSFSFPGYSGRFYFDNNRNPVLVPQSDLQVKVYYDSTGTRYNFNGFLIIAPNGDEYHFARTDASPVVALDYIETNRTVNPVQDGYNPNDRSTWMLSKIISADKKDVINFTYENELYGFWVINQISNTTGIIGSNTGATSFGGGVDYPIRTDVTGKRLSSIVTSNQKVLFTPDASPRTDLSLYSSFGTGVNNQCKGLSELVVTDIYDRCIIKAKFHKSTITSSTSTGVPGSQLPPDDADTKRLYLDSIVLTDCTGGTSLTHGFEYIDRNTLPRRFTYGQDHWGFFNGKDNNTSLNPGGAYAKTACYDPYSGPYCPEQGQREPAFPAAQKGTLKKVIYPTGGTTELIYELNEVIENTTSCGGGVITQGSWWGGSCTATNSGSISLTLTASDVANGYLEVKSSYCQSASGYAEIRSLSGIVYANASPGTTIKLSNTTMPSAGGSFTLYLYTSGAVIDYKVFTKLITSGLQNVAIGGLRVKEIKTYDGSNVVNTKSYNYGENYAVSSGRLVSKPKYIATYNVKTGGTYYKSNGESITTSFYYHNTANGTFTNVSNLLTVGYYPLDNSNSGCYFNGVASYEIPNCYINANNSSVVTNKVYQNRTTYGFHSASMIPDGAQIMGNHIAYRKVTTTETDKGIVVRYYNMGIFENGPYTPTGFPYTPPPYDPSLGNVTGEEIYDHNGELVEWNTYTYLNQITTVMPKGYTSPLKLRGSAAQNYALETGYSLPTGKISRFNDLSTYDIVETSANYGYNTANGHFQKAWESVTNSDGTIYRTEYKYPKDYACPNTGCTSTNADMEAILTMRKRNLVALPVEVVKSYKIPSSSVYSVYDASLIQYAKIANDANHIKPVALFKFLTNAPTTAFTYSSGNATAFTRHAQYTREYNFDYNATNGRLQSQWKEYDPAKQQYVWSHASKKPIARVINAEASEIAYTGFETATNSLDNGVWQHNGVGGGFSDAPGNAYIGRSGFNLSVQRTLSKSGMPAGTYIVSLFHKLGSIYINGTLVSTNSSSTWKYVEHKLSVTSGTVTISSNTGGDWYQLVDEVRLHPADALMTTYSYHDGSLVPMSIADENSVAQHYEYDGLWRLLGVYDQNRNLRQAYAYDYKMSGALNRVRTYKTNTPVTTVASAYALSGANVERSFQYYDGIGRPTQKVDVALSPSSNDIISNVVYDLAHRAVKDYTPYTETSNGGNYRPAWQSTQTAFVNTYDASTQGYGYFETRFEKSPLSRPLEVGKPTSLLRIGNGRTQEMIYRANYSFDAVRDFNNGTFFPALQLIVEEMIDENERKKWVFKDKLGRVVLVKQQMATNPTNEIADYARTYTVYDHFGRVSYVIPPEASRAMAASGNWSYTSATYANMVYKYDYNTRTLLYSKKVPGRNAETTLYDRLDRPVLVTTANGIKLFTKYDILSRPIQTGRYIGSLIPSNSNPLYEVESTSTNGYTNTAYPTLGVYYTINYYDHYDINRNGTIESSESYQYPGSGYEVSATGKTRGKPTGSKTGVFNGTSASVTKLLTALSFYDSEYAVIQTNAQNNLGGSDITSSAYDFADRMQKMKRVHTTSFGSSVTTEYGYGYDHASRPIYTTIKMGNDPVKVLSKLSYDELGRMKEKNLHSNAGTSPTTATDYTQSCDYKYNLLGWLKAINETFDPNQAGDINPDLFMLGMEYGVGATPHYNGNIDAMAWNVNRSGHSIGNVKQYRMTYDAANRVTNATYWTMNTSWQWANPDSYSEKSISYDLNGNIKTLTRTGITAGTTTFGNMDVLSYTYDAAIPDRLLRVQDAGTANKGFIQGSTATSTYSYDNAGNMTNDAHKGLTIAYNFMNLPATVTKAGGGTITFEYTATGQKLTKIVNGTVTRHYAGGIEYDGNTLAVVYNEEGRCIPNGSSWHYEYSLKDHLGNTRVNFRANTSTTAYTFLDEHHYYAFGLEQELPGLGGGDKYRYNGKELNEDLGLNWLDYGARWYDASIGRWHVVDPKADHPNQIDKSPYAAFWNNPVRLSDPDGKCPHCPDEEYIPLAEHVYSSAKKGDVTVNGWEVIDITNNDSGLQGKLYRGTSASGFEGQYIYATAGTQDISVDGVEDFKQLLGTSKQYSESVGIAKELAQNYEGLSFTGHSLGGGLASANALAIEGKAVTFNAAGLSKKTKSNLELTTKTANITAYVVLGEAVDHLQSGLRISAEGDIRYLPSPTKYSNDKNPWTVLISNGFTHIPKRIQNHGMDVIKKQIKKQ